MLCFLIPQDPLRPLDIGRCVQMALIHDLAEAHVGDITPVEGVTPEMKHQVGLRPGLMSCRVESAADEGLRGENQLEDEAMNSFLNEMLGGEWCREARERIASLWEVSSASVHFGIFLKTVLMDSERRKFRSTKLGSHRSLGWSRIWIGLSWSCKQSSTSDVSSPSALPTSPVPADPYICLPRLLKPTTTSNP